jgi:ankyrin repeat protein
MLPGTFAAIDRRRMLGILASAVTAGLVPESVWGTASRCDSASPSPDVATFLAAVQNGNRTAIVNMLDQDASLARAADTSGRSAFVLAHLARQPDIASLISERGIELDVVEAVLAADWVRVELLATANPAIMNAAHPIGGNPLYASGLTGGAEQYRIRSLGADSDGRPIGGTGFTPARAAMDCADPLGAWLAATDILSNGGQVNAPQAGGDSILHGAVRARDTRLVRLAIRKGGDINARDDAGRTPNDLARTLEWQDGIDLFSGEARIPRDYRRSRLAFNASREPFTLLPINEIPALAQSEATGLSHFNLTRVQELHKKNPLLIHAISTDAELAIEACGHTGQREIVRLHLDYGAPLSLPTAISLGDLDHAAWLLKRDPLLVHERGPHDFPVMWYPAIGQGSVEAAEMLLKHGAPIEQESAGETALHWAALRGHADLISFLVEEGANLHAVGYKQDRAGRTPLQLAVDNGRDEAIRVLKGHGAT